jgi:methanogenic corrinoid protein MtbC1
MFERDNDMKQARAFAAELLEHGAAGYASAATACLIGTEPVPGRAQPAFSRWKQHFVQRVIELAAAIESGEPQLFVARAVWMQRAWTARGLAAPAAADNLSALRSALAEALPEQARAIPLQYLDAALEAIAHPHAPEPPGLDPGRPRDRLALAYLEDVLEGHVPAAIERTVAAHEAGMGVTELLLDVLMPAQREVGRLWHLAQMSVAEEHLVTSATLRAMAVIAARAPRRADRGRTVLAAAVAGNPHHAGIRAIAYLLELDGWRTIYLGDDVPIDDLPGAVKFFAADVVMLSSALSVQLGALRQTIARLRAFDADVRIMVGGRVFQDAPELWRELGADRYAADGREAIRVAAELAG